MNNMEEYVWCKDETIKQMLTSDECIRGKNIIRLLEELEETWHGDYVIKIVI